MPSALRRARREDTGTQRWAHEDTDCQQSNAATSQGTPRATREPPQTQGRVLPVSLGRGTTLANTLGWDFRPLQLGENKFLLFQATQVVVTCEGSYRKTI